MSANDFCQMMILKCVQEEQHRLVLEKEALARVKAERDFEETNKQLQTTIESKRVTDQQLAELQSLTTKVGYQPNTVVFTFS